MFSTNINPTTDFYILCKRGGGVSRHSVEFFLSHSAEKSSYGVSENFWYRKISRIRGEGAPITIFRRICFCLTVPKNFVREPSVFDKILVSKIFMHKKGRGITILFRNCFVPQYRNIS